MKPVYSSQGCIQYLIIFNATIIIIITLSGTEIALFPASLLPATVRLGLIVQVNDQHCYHYFLFRWSLCGGPK